jgi:hypothetical protein
MMIVHPFLSSWLIAEKIERSKYQDALPLPQIPRLSTQRLLT